MKPMQLIETATCGGMVPYGIARRAVEQAGREAPARQLATGNDPALMRREDDEVQCRLGPDADLVIDASHCIVICTPERRITVGNVDHWDSSLANAKINVALLDQLADEERRYAQAERLRNQPRRAASQP